VRKILVQLSAALLGFLLLAAAPVSSLAQTETTASTDTAAIVNIPDPSLRTFLHQKTNVSENKPIRRKNLYALTGALDCSGKRIANAEGLQYCINIEELKLSDNVISDLPDLSALTKLHTLDLAHNSFAKLPESVLALVRLQTLNLGFNLLDMLPSGFSALSSLRSLDLQSNKLLVFPAVLTTLKLETLDISNNTVSKLPDVISGMMTLKSLSANHCGLGKLPAELFNIESIRKLSLNDNEFTSLSKSITKLSALEELYLSGNQLESLPDEICALVKLKIFDVSRNRLFSLPAKIGDLAAEELLLNGNYLSTLPASLAKEGKLKKLDVRLNRITKLPEAFKNLRTEYFNIEWNFLELTEDEEKTLKALSSREKFYLHQLTKIKNLEAKSMPEAITITWSPCANGSDEHTAWKVERYTVYAVSGGEISKIAEVTPDKSEYTVGSLSPATPYQFKISVEYTVTDNTFDQGATAHYALIEVRTADPSVSGAPQPSTATSPSPSFSIPAFTTPPTTSAEAIPQVELQIPAWVIIMILCAGFAAVIAIILLLFYFRSKRRGR
jgi:Leucine-rich repeat (LRR) protein